MLKELKFGAFSLVLGHFTQYGQFMPIHCITYSIQSRFVLRPCNFVAISSNRINIYILVNSHSFICWMSTSAWIHNTRVGDWKQFSTHQNLNWRTTFRSFTAIISIARNLLSSVILITSNLLISLLTQLQNLLFYA